MTRAHAFSLILAASVIVLVAAGCRVDRCPEPTLEQCQDPSWLETDECGMEEYVQMATNPESTCNQLLLDEAEALSEAQEEELVVLPESLGGGTGMAKVEPNPERGLDDVDLPLTYAGFVQRAAISAVDGGLSPEEQALRDQWDANGNRVASCREYVFEKYYDYARFEDAVAARHADFSYVTDVAFGETGDPIAIGTRAADSETLKMKDGSDMTVQTLDYVICHYAPECYGGSEIEIQNIFQAMPLRLFDQVEGDLTGLRLQGDGEHCYDSCHPPWEPPPFGWHLERREAARSADLTEVEMDAMYPVVRSFREALEDYERITQGGASDCCPLESPPAPGSPCESDYAECVSIEARLVELFEQALEASCIVGEMGDGATLCDWSPTYFVESLRTSFGSAMEADYQRCLDLTDDDFEALSNYVFHMPDGTEWPTYPAEDYTVTASTVDLFFSRHAEHRQALFDWYTSRLPADLFDEQTGEVRAPGNAWSNSYTSSNEGFGVDLGYELSWGLTGFDPENEQMEDDLCLVGFEADGRVWTKAWAFWSEPLDILDAHVKVGLASSASEGHLYVLGEEIWNRDPVEEWQFARALDRNKTLLEKERVITIYGVPVARIAGGVAGTLHLDAGAEVEGGRQFDDINENGHVDPGESCTLDPIFHAYFTPWAQLEAFGEGGPYIVIAEAGVRLDLLLLRLDLPFTFDVSLYSDTDPIGAFVFDVITGADLEARTLDGRITSYATLGPDFLGLTVAKELFEWTALRWSIDLFEYRYTVSLGYLLGAMSL